MVWKLWNTQVAGELLRSLLDQAGQSAELVTVYAVNAAGNRVASDTTAKLIGMDPCWETASSFAQTALRQGRDLRELGGEHVANHPQPNCCTPAFYGASVRVFGGAGKLLGVVCLLGVEGSKAYQLICEVILAREFAVAEN